VGYGRIDAERILFKKDIKPTEMDVFWALRAFGKTGNREAIELLVDAGWDIHRLVNEYTAPILGSVIENALFRSAARLTSDTVLISSE
jgi:hypothetical protein